MHIITRKRLNEFAEKHPTAISGLAHWYRVLNAEQSRELRGTTACVPARGSGRRIDGFQHRREQSSLGCRHALYRRKVYIRAVLTHAEYDDGNWKER